MSDTPLNIELEHVFDIKLYFDRRLQTGPMAGEWDQGYTSVKEGVITGPRLQGKVLKYSGADWALIRADGIVELNAHYMLQADDGALIYIRNQGYVYGSRPETLAKYGRYFRCTPYFRAPNGPHDWLNRTVIVGTGERRPQQSPDGDPDHSIFSYYAVR
jgi:hypothetical protein